MARVRIDIRTVVRQCATVAMATTGAMSPWLSRGVSVAVADRLAVLVIVVVPVVVVLALVVLEVTVAQEAAVRLVGDRQVVAKLRDVVVVERNLLYRTNHRGHAFHHVHLDVAVDEEISPEA
jgi:hypothetical protein